jgi:probable rRNA maturation factor
MPPCGVTRGFRAPGQFRRPMIENRQRRVRVPLGSLAEFAERARRAAGLPPDSVTVRLVSDAAIARMNRTWRGKRGPTDVLSFPATNGAPRRAAAAGYAGDIAIAPETARRNARRLGRSLDAELRVLILHGMLHLAGYDHETDRGEMERLERRLRRRLGIR